MPMDNRTLRAAALSALSEYDYRTVNAVRDAFWNAHPEFLPERRTRKRQNDYRCDIRVAFVCFVQELYEDGQCSTSMTLRATL